MDGKVLIVNPFCKIELYNIQKPYIIRSCPALGLSLDRTMRIPPFIHSDSRSYARGQSKVKKPDAVIIWLAVCCAMVAAMVVIGGYTRLSGAGLSIVDWRPIGGILPPLNTAEWRELFQQYQAFPEYRLHHLDMTLAEFKAIFWPEYIHRIWGRLIGIVFALPLLWFTARGTISRREAIRLGLIFLLGAVQGILGWYMVKSGLVDDGRVSHYRLAAHLVLALLIYGLLLHRLMGRWMVSLDIVRPAIDRHLALRPISRSLPRSIWASMIPSCLILSRLTLTMIGLTILSGAFVSGLDGGKIHNTFPLMSSHWIAPDINTLSPWYANITENPSTVQFIHRLLATMTLVITLVTAIVGYRRAKAPPDTERDTNRDTSRAKNLDANRNKDMAKNLDTNRDTSRTGARFGRMICVFLGIGVAWQFTLGVATLTHGAPLSMAVAHQASAIVLFTVAIIHLRVITPFAKRSRPSTAS